MFVFDTSAFINGWRDHYMPNTFPSVWDLIGKAMDDGRVIVPREVLNELEKKDDDVFAWVKDHSGAFVEPSVEVQRQAGEVFALLEQRPVVRDSADPFVIAEARIRSLTVVTYEGRTFSGVPTKNWSKSMPGICQHLGVPCRTLPQALHHLGGSF
jgi:uncharacterized protein DUF4411